MVYFCVPFETHKQMASIILRFSSFPKMLLVKCWRWFVNCGFGNQALAFMKHGTCTVWPLLAYKEKCRQIEKHCSWGWVHCFSFWRGEGCTTNEFINFCFPGFWLCRKWKRSTSPPVHSQIFVLPNIMFPRLKLVSLTRFLLCSGLCKH